MNKQVALKCIGVCLVLFLGLGIQKTSAGENNNKPQIEDIINKCVADIEAAFVDVRPPARAEQLARDAMEAINEPSGLLLRAMGRFWGPEGDAFREQMKGQKPFEECTRFAGKVVDLLEGIECAQSMNQLARPQYTYYTDLVSKSKPVDRAVGSAAICDYLVMFHS